jgi:predicted TIM-barrel fold metal-dependent hydrolase
MPSNLGVPFPPDPNPKTPKFKIPGTIDTHFHIFGPPQVFPYTESRLYTPPAAPIEHWFEMAKAVGIDRGVLVVPAVHGFDNAVMHDAIAKSDGRLRGMVRANPKATEADNKALNAQGVRGIRFNLKPKLAGHFDEAEMMGIISRIRNLPWCVCLHTESDLIVKNADLIRRLDMPTIIDHFGQVDPAKGVDNPEFKVVLDLLGEKHIWVKLAAADRWISEGQDFGNIVKLARALIAKAPDRVIWGTDWPHAYIYEANGMINDGDLMNFMVDFPPDAETRKKILVDNPARLFGF